MQKSTRPDNRHTRISEALAAIGLTIQAGSVGGRLTQRVIAQRQAARRVA